MGEYVLGSNIRYTVTKHFYFYQNLQKNYILILTFPR